MQSITVKLNSQSLRQIVYVSKTDRKTIAVIGGKEKREAEQQGINFTHKVIVYSDSCGSSIAAINNHFKNCAINAVNKL